MNSKVIDFARLIYKKFRFINSLISNWFFYYSWTLTILPASNIKLKIRENFTKKWLKIFEMSSSIIFFFLYYIFRYLNQEILLEPARKLGNDINTFVIKKNIFYALVKELNCSFVTKLLYARFISVFICYSNYISLPPPPLYLHCYLLPLFFYSSPILIYSSPILPLIHRYSPPTLH